MEGRERCFFYTTTLVVTDPSPEKQGTPEPAASLRHLEMFTDRNAALVVARERTSTFPCRKSW